MKKAPKCKENGCGNSTRDTSGFCHHHRLASKLHSSSKAPSSAKVAPGKDREPSLESSTKASAFIDEFIDSGYLTKGWQRFSESFKEIGPLGTLTRADIINTLSEAQTWLEKKPDEDMLDCLAISSEALASGFDDFTDKEFIELGTYAPMTMSAEEWYPREYDSYKPSDFWRTYITETVAREKKDKKFKLPSEVQFRMCAANYFKNRFIFRMRRIDPDILRFFQSQGRFDGGAAQQKYLYTHPSTPKEWHKLADLRAQGDSTAREKLKEKGLTLFARHNYNRYAKMFLVDIPEKQKSKELVKGLNESFELFQKKPEYDSITGKAQANNITLAIKNHILHPNFPPRLMGQSIERMDRLKIQASNNEIVRMGLTSIEHDGVMHPAALKHIGALEIRNLLVQISPLNLSQISINHSQKSVTELKSTLVNLIKEKAYRELEATHAPDSLKIVVAAIGNPALKIHLSEEEFRSLEEDMLRGLEEYAKKGIAGIDKCELLMDLEDIEESSTSKKKFNNTKALLNEVVFKEFQSHPELIEDLALTSQYKNNVYTPRIPKSFSASQLGWLEEKMLSMDGVKEYMKDEWQKAFQSHPNASDISRTLGVLDT